MLWISLNLAVFSALEISSLSEGGFRHRSLLCREGGREKPDLIQQKCFESVQLCGNMGRVLFVFQCATKRLLKTSKLVTKWNIHPAHGLALNSDMVLEKQQCSNPTVSPHFETSCLPLTSSKTSEAQLLKTEENQLQPDIKPVKYCLFIKWKEGQIREEMRSPRRTRKKWLHKRERGCCCCWCQDCRRRLNQFSQFLHEWGGLSTPKSLLIWGRKDSGVTEGDRGLKPWVPRWMCREEAAEPSPCRITRFYRVGRANPALAAKVAIWAVFWSPARAPTPVLWV
ncbi:LOW QUALITY PROTEIN: uncharacterized protein M8220_010495 [Acridotheres tristis]